MPTMTRSTFAIGVAIEEIIGVIDKGMPKDGDFFSSYQHAKWTPLYLLAHWGIENGLKALLREKGEEYHGSNLSKAYNKLKQVNVEAAEALGAAFYDAVSFYSIDVNRWEPFRTLDTFFNKFGSETCYKSLPYWPLDGETDLNIPPFIHRELLAALEEQCQHGSAQTTSLRIEQNVKWSIIAAFEGHLKGCTECTRDELLRGLDRWFHKDSSPTEKLRYAFRHNFFISNDGCVNATVRSFCLSLMDGDDFVVRYYIHKFDDIPEGSVNRPSDIELVSDEHGVVRIRDGETLGVIHQDIDSRWRAYPIWTSRKRRYAKTRIDAMNWLIDECTFMVNLIVDNGWASPRRVVYPSSNNRRRARAGLPPEHELIFADGTHDLKVGQELRLLGDRAFLFGSASGTITGVDGRRITYA